MNRRKLELYEALFKQYGPHSSHTIMADIAKAFVCSERHARTLLKQMSSYLWLKWLPTKGRGQKGQITCLIEPESACYLLVNHAVAAEKYDQVDHLLGFNQRDVSMGLKRYLASSVKQNSSTIFARFHRQINQLHPHLAFERTERHLIHEIFQTLVNSENHEIKPELAHTWKCSDDGKIWTFYLRESATFHDGSSVDAYEVVNNFKTLSISDYWHSLYQHMIEVKAISSHVAQFTLSETDYSFAQLLSRAETAIMPSNQIYQPSHAYTPIGSGPFMVDIHSSRLIRLKRYPQYTGVTALINQIELWIYENWAEEKKCDQNFFFIHNQEDSYQVSTKEIGYFFLLLNRRELQRNEIKEPLVRFLETGETPNLNLTVPVNLSHENNNESRKLAKKLKGILPNVISEEVTFGHSTQRQDIRIGGIRCEYDKVTSFVAFFKLYPYWKRDLSWDQHSKLQAQIRKIRASYSPHEREYIVDKILKQLDDDNIMTIINSEDLTLNVPSRLKNVKINKIGWCDFAKLWLD